MKYEKGSGQVLCSHCNKGIEGDAVIGYTYESDYVEDVRIVHKDCVKPFKLALAGKTYKCPKCEGLGKIQVRVELEPMWSGYDHIMESQTCDLCSGDGYLDKPPVPVITSWKRG